MCHAASGMAANYNLLIDEFEGCPIPVLKGEPLSVKTTAMKAALSVFGITKCFSGKFDISYSLYSLIFNSLIALIFEKRKLNSIKILLMFLLRMLQ